MRPGNHWIAYVIVAATALVVQAQAPTLRFAGVDIHGTEQDRAELLRGIALPPARDSVAMDEARIEAICADVRRTLDGERFIHVGCAVVGYATGEAYVVVDVVEPDNAERISFPAIQYVDHLKLAERGGERRSEELIACVRGCSQAADRADALDFLNRLDWGKASCRATLHALDDRDWTVRNQAAMLLNQHLADCVDALGSTRIVDASLRQLTRPTHTDRNKAITTLDQLIRRHAGIDDARRGRILAAAEQLARQSDLPNVGGAATALAELIRQQHADVTPPSD